MYLNIGGDFSVRGETIVGVFDLDNTSCSKWTRKFHAAILQRRLQEPQRSPIPGKGEKL